MSQTPEDRIRAQYKAEKPSYYRDGYPISWLFMALARKWKRPVREIKRICGYQVRTQR